MIVPGACFMLFGGGGGDIPEELDILNDTYFSTDFCSGPYWGGPDGDDLSTNYPSMQIYFNDAIEALNLTSIIVNIEFASAHAAITELWVNSGAFPVAAVTTVPENASTASFEISSFSRQFLGTDDFYITIYPWNGTTWTLKSITAVEA